MLGFFLNFLFNVTAAGGRIRANLISVIEIEESGVQWLKETRI